MTVALDRYVALEEMWATLYHVIPQAVKWIYLRVTGQISEHDLGEGAALYVHKVAGDVIDAALPVLLAHGDHGHPFTMLHFAEAMQDRPVYSVYIPDSAPERGMEAMARAIDRVCALARRKALFGIGHSKGGIYLVAQKYQRNDWRLSKVFTIGSRIRVDQSCKPELAAFVQGLRDAGGAEDLTQGIPSRDWCASRASLLGRCNLDIDGSHLSALFNKRVLDEAIKLGTLVA